MSQLGLFGWIREGVKQSVLMGVSDAIETIGTPDESTELHPALQAFAKTPIQRISSSKGNESAAPRIGSEGTSRKRLGRSLKDINPPKTPPVSPAS